MTYTKNFAFGEVVVRFPLKLGLGTQKGPNVFDRLRRPRYKFFLSPMVV